MAFLAISRAARKALTMNARLVLRVLPRNLDLTTETDTVAGHEPPVRISPDGAEWNVYCSPLFCIEDAAVAALVLKNITALPSPGDVDSPKSNALVRQETLAVIGKPVVPEIPEGEDPYTFTLAYHLAPAAVRMFAGVPDGWKPKEV